MADDKEQAMESVAISDKTGSCESPDMETAPECTSDSVDGDSTDESDAPRLPNRDPFSADGNPITDTSSNLDEIHNMLDDPENQDIGPQPNYLFSTHDAFKQPMAEPERGIELNDLHELHWITESESGNEDEVDSFLPRDRDRQFDANGVACKSCSSKVEKIYRDTKLSRFVISPCKLCLESMKEPTEQSEIHCKNAPLTESSGENSPKQHFQSLMNKMKRALKSCNQWEMNQVLTELTAKAINLEGASAQFEKSLQRVLFEAILCGKHHIAKTIISHSHANIFKAERDLFQESDVTNFNHDIDNTDVKITEPDVPISKTDGDLFTGQTALHLAVSHGNEDIVNQILDRITEEEAIDLINRQATGRFFTDNKKVPEGQYCLFLAAWMGCTDIFRLLIKRGASLNVQDKDGNTILHKLVQLSMKKTESDQDKNQGRWVDTTKVMCEIVFKFAGTWWQKFIGERRHHKKCTKEALTYLLSIEDSAGFTPMGLAAYMGSSHLYQMMIDSPAYKTEHLRYGPITDASFRMNEIDSSLCGNDGSSHLESILYNSIDKACEFISIEPISTLVMDKWKHYRKFFYLWLITYILYMSAFTTYTFIRPTNIDNITALYSRSVDKFRAFLEVVMVLGIPWYLYGEIQDLCYPRHRRWPDPWKYIQDGFYRIIRVFFVLSLIAWIFIHFAKPDHEDTILPLCLFFGWVYVIIFTCGSEAFGIFPVMLQRMIFLDLLRFLLIFFLIIMSMSTAMYTVFRPTPNVLDYATFWDTAYSLFKMTLGLQDVSNLTEARHPGIAILLFVVYAVLGNILLLNVLIAMMNASYSAVSEKAPVYHLETLQRAYNTLLIERRLPRCLCTSQV